METAHTRPMKGDAFGLSIWSVQAHRCRNGSLASSGGRASSPTAAAPVTASGLSFRVPGCKPGPKDATWADQTSCFSPQKQANGLSLYGAISRYPAPR